MKTIAALSSLLAAMLLLTGCKAGEESGKKDKHAQPEKQPSTMTTMIDGLTGAQAVRTGRNAQERIRSIASDRDTDLEEAMGNE